MMKYIASCSFGKDSLAMVLKILKRIYLWMRLFSLTLEWNLILFIITETE